MNKITIKELLNNNDIRISDIKVRKVIERKDVLNYDVSVSYDWSLNNEVNDVSYLYEVEVAYFDHENYESGIIIIKLEDERGAKYVTTQLMIKKLNWD